MNSENQPVEREESQQPDAEEERDEKPEVKVDDEGGVTVNLAERKTRKERRADRYSDVVNDRNESRKEVENLRRQVSEMQSQMYRGFQEVRQIPPQQRAEEQADPHKRQLSDIRREQESILAALKAGGTENPEALKNRYYELEDRRNEVIEDRLEARISKKLPRGQQEGDYATQQLSNEYPDVVNHRAAMEYAYGQYYSMVGEGEPRTLATSRKAMQKAAERFGFAKPTAPAPTATQQQKYGGVPAQAGAKSSPTGMRLSKDQQRMATARWPQLEPEQAFARWAEMFRKYESSQSTDPNE